MAEAAYLLREIDAAKKREKDYREKGKEILQIYEGKKNTPFNILFSNTETLLPALYSAIPKPIVERRYKDADVVGKAAAEAATRGLKFLLDTNVEGYETFDEGIRGAVLDALLPGRGVASVKYDAKIEGDYKGAELVCLNTRSWDKVYFGFAKKWSEVPWVCYESEVDREEFRRVVGQVPRDVVFSDSPEEREDKEVNEEAKSQRKTTILYTLWYKPDRKVYFLSPNVKDRVLKSEDDPLKLTGFFDCPRPLQFVEKSNDLCPTPLYKLYETQAKELNRIQIRISKIVEAIKARGVYDSSLGVEIEKVLQEEDNALVPSDKTASLAAESGLQNAIWMLPIQELVAALQQLYVARDSCKQVIFEIIGLADIMRGASNASETLGAQQIKQQWGSSRLKRTQKEVMRYVRDCLRMMLEVAATQFNEVTWARMTGLPFLTEQQFMSLQAQMKAAQQQAMTAQMQPPGQPPNPAQQQLQQIQQQLQTPAWKDVLALLRDDIQRAYRIDIEMNSTLDPEMMDEQRQMGELLNGIGQAINGIGPLVENGTMPFEAAQGLLLTVVKKFQLGSEVEELFRNMKQPEKPDPNAAAQAEAQQKQQAEQAKLQADTQVKVAQEQTKQVEAQKEAEVSKYELDKKYEFEMWKVERELEAQKDIEGIRGETQVKAARAGRPAMFKTREEADKADQMDEEDRKLLGETAMKVDSLAQNFEQAVTQIAEAVGQIEQTVNQLAADVNSTDPIEMLKGPDGRTTHVRKGLKTIPIVRRSVQ